MEDYAGAVPAAPAAGAGYLYLHVPFCELLCPFCSFHRVQHNSVRARAYFHSLREEVRRYHAAGFRFTGAYFGGGTPTTEPAELVETVALVRELFGIESISVETNPKDLRPEILEPLRAAGVTRLSVGVQSFDDRLLRDMERFEKYGSSAQIQAQIQGVAGLFPTLNLDMIFNQPHQTLESLERDLAIFRGLGANQVSFYPLMTSRTVERRMGAAMGTPDRRRLGSILPGHSGGPEGSDFAPSSAWCFTRHGHRVGRIHRGGGPLCRRGQRRFQLPGRHPCTRRPFPS